MENSIVFERYAERGAAAIAELLASFSIPFQDFEVENRDMVIIFNRELGATDRTAYSVQGRELGVASYFDWKQSYNEESKLECKLALNFANSYSECL